MNALPNNLSNVAVNMPIRAQTMLANGFPVQSVGEFDNSSNLMAIEAIYMYDPSNNGLDPYWLDPSGALSQGASRYINQIYKYNDKDINAHPIIHSNKFAINKYPIYKA